MRERNHICAKSLRLEVSRRRNRGRRRKRWRDNIKEDMKKYQLTEDMAQDRKYWMTKILAGPVQGDGQERWERWESAVYRISKSLLHALISNVDIFLPITDGRSMSLKQTVEGYHNQPKYMDVWLNGYFFGLSKLSSILKVQVAIAFLRWIPVSRIPSFVMIAPTYLSDVASSSFTHWTVMSMAFPSFRRLGKFFWHHFVFFANWFEVQPVASGRQSNVLVCSTISYLFLRWYQCFQRTS